MTQEPFNDEILSSLCNIPGEHTDPGTTGLALSIEKTADQFRRKWRLRIQIHGRRFYRTLGEYPETTLKEARERAVLCRQIFIDCFDLKGPFSELIFFRDNPKTVESLWLQWAAYEQNRGSGHAEKMYKDSIGRGKNHVFAEIGNMAPEEVTSADIARILNLAYQTLHESTVKKLRQDISKFFHWCRANSFLPSEKLSPADAALLSVLVCRPGKRIKGYPHPALSGKDVRRFVGFLLTEKFRHRTSAMALLFTLLTASRIGNITGSLNRELTQPARWVDFDKQLTLWTIPAENMKCGYRNGEHVVPISKQARNVLLVMKKKQIGLNLNCPYVFATRNGKQFDYRLLLDLIKTISKADLALGGNGFVDEISGQRIHIHGFRSTFKTWGTDHGVDWTLTELALHHNIDKLRYDRAKAITRRRKIMQQWADFCCSEEASMLLKELADQQ